MTMHYLDESHIFLFLAQVFVLLLATRVLGEIFRRRNQPPLTAELLVGIVLGPTIFGRFLPGLHAALFPPDAAQQNMLETVAWLGVLFLLMDTGLEIDFSVAWRQRGNALVIALCDIIIPMLVAFVPCVLLPSRYLANPDQRVIFALFMATVMTISAMPIAARVLHDLKMLKADLGFLIMSALAVNDIIGWVLFTIVIGLFTQTTIHAGGILAIFAATIGFAALALTFGRRLSTRALDLLHGARLPEPGASLTFACLLGLLFGAFTQRIGIHALFGFFIAGVVMGEAKNLSEESRGIISQMVYALFVPLFFANIGLKIDFAANFDLLLVGLVSLIGIAGRYLGAWVGVNLTRVPRVNRHMISIAHTPGGMMEIVVALLALESGLITAPVFVAIVFSAVFSSVVMGPWMRDAMKRRAVVRVADFLARESVIPALAAATRTEALRELAARAAERTGAATREAIEAAALTRELDFGTAVGEGLAIPHVRLDDVKQPVLVAGRSPAGLEWDAPDGEPVRHVFFIVTPADAQDLHVQILAQIASVMQDRRNRDLIDRAADADALWQVLKGMLSARQVAAGPSRKSASAP
ncbi:MAG: cation:proton antiporter [Kiritimatiellae bacterium]|nr:cation:proton antiporter [Kiritimatiellia bacterium]